MLLLWRDNLVQKQTINNTDATYELSDQFPLLARRIFLENPNDTIINFTSLRSELKTTVESSPYWIGLYFQYLPTGISIGINDREMKKFASLLKVPIAMSVYEGIEKNDWKLDTQLSLDDQNKSDKFGTLFTKPSGTKLSIQEATAIMLRESDNTAKNMLFSLIGKNRLSDTLATLDINIVPDGSDISISPKSYASIFQSLYFSSRLTKKHSQELLEYLTESTFTDGMTGAIPKEIKVAQKMGIHEVSNSNDSVYSNCGIVYLSKRNYIFCSMVSGTDQKTAWKTIQLLAKKTYNFVSLVNNQ